MWWLRPGAGNKSFCFPSDFPTMLLAHYKSCWRGGQGCVCRIKLILALLWRFNCPYFSSCKSQCRFQSWLPPPPSQSVVTASVVSPSRSQVHCRSGHGHGDAAAPKGGLFTCLCPQLHPVAPVLALGVITKTEMVLILALYHLGHLNVLPNFSSVEQS